MLHSKAKWEFAEKQDSTIDLQDDTFKLSPIIKELLLQRGITTSEAASLFLSPDITTLHSPGGLAAVNKATERIQMAITKQEKILIYGDYDADGVSSTTVLLKALQELGADCDYYIPNRFSEGYGPNETAFREAFDHGFRLIITVDTGIASVHEASVAKELGIDLIITDHHEVQEQLPDAFAVIHPKCSPDYPFKELAGVGVAFKLAEHLLGYFPKHLLEFVAIGTIADLVPLVKENRILAYHGLRALTASDNPGIKALKKICKIEGRVTEEDVGFLIGPRINAVGRLQDADLAVQLLMTEDQVEANQLAEEIQLLNQERQQIVNDIVKEAEKLVHSDRVKSVIIVAKEGWNEGVLGIVASKLVRKYDRPAIVLTIKPDTSEVKGSARSIPAFDLFSNGMKVRELFTHFGGHSQAAGMTLPRENLESLEESLNKIIQEELTEDDFKQVIKISNTISVADINEELLKEIDKLAPFGMKNPKPVFEVNDIPFESRQIGSNQSHLKLLFKKDNVMLEGIGFGMGELRPYITPHTAISLVGELGINEWNGNKKIQLVLQDMRIESWQLFDHRGKKNADISPFLDNSKRNLLLSNRSTKLYSDVDQVAFSAELSSLTEIDVLYVYDLPPDLSQFKEIIRKTNPANIHVCYYVEDSTYLKSFPSREEFKWYYALLLKRKVVDMKQEMTAIMNTRGWSKERIIFMSKVFFELGFVTIENGVIHLNPQPLKKDLQDSPLYQDRIKRAEIEKTLYYSNYNELKEWFSNCMDYLESAKEEVAHGL
ncbi:single-stranded-DNA-specific exonuclease RecJ [Virgibacillus sp. C22-A2]|uniref:Single-stranded-DNA-specific exonuclease RecJ n=1 Tax=Virgibacillus tibetensis TaxID=3042313 RepID=A0ABU6KC95_9BACI|nr:single-stranded-DNA-specific exonuclease RecJ [Virgibacillus sp. C22-A2]